MASCGDDLAAIIAALILDSLPTVADSPLTVVHATDPLEPLGGGGILASRLIQDWFAGRLVYKDTQAGPPTECPALRVFPSRPGAGSDHDLVIIPSQSYDAAHDPEARGRSLLSCMCRYCRYHFVFHILPSDPGEGQEHLQHHIRECTTEWYQVSDLELSPASKLYPAQGRVRYACTLCNMNIALEMTVPRLKPEWIRTIMDEDRIREAVRVAKQEDPERYADATPAKEAHYMTTPLSTLNQYLRNILDDDGTGPQKRISFRNKTFFVQFGRDCEHIFRYLNFQEHYEEDTQDSYWVPPRLTLQEGKTPLGSPRAFFEDVRSEVQSVLDDKPPIDGQPVVLPISARGPLEKALGCDRVSSTGADLPVIGSEAHHFWTLGAPVDADEALLKFAFEKQIQRDPEHASAYVEALGGLSARRSVDLQMFVFTQQELLTRQQNDRIAAASNAGPTEKAYAHFGLTRDIAGSPQYFIGVYKNYRDQSPAQRSDHRVALLHIGKDRDSQEILHEVYGTKMEISEACQFLGVEPEWPMDSIAAMAQTVASDSDIDLLIMALDTVSRSRPGDDPNRAAFENIVTELRSSRQLQDSSGAFAADDGDANAPESSRAAVDMELPVGLGNLRNTCYLNSILQYFYSVNAVRDLALNSDLPALEPTEMNVRNLLRSGSAGADSPSQPDLETGRAFVGHEFTRELSTLFRELDASGNSSLSPRQRLANAALLRPEELHPRSADHRAVSDSGNTDAPPLPPRENPNTRVSETPMDEVETSEIASAGSSQTLVGDGVLITTTTVQSVEKRGAQVVDGADGQLPAGNAAGNTSEAEANMSKLTVEELAVELDKPNVGSDQMDVDEVMGNAIDHLRAAFRLARIGHSDAVPDPIKQAFFSTFIDNRKKTGESTWNRTSRLDRWVTAYPAQSGTRELYDALANSFDLEPLPGNLLSFTTIEQPAPHFHICIQRSDGVRKNANPITIPETLYLDRFMHTTDTQSPLYQARRRGWDIKTRLNEVATAAANVPSGTANAGQQLPGPLKSNPQDDDIPDDVLDEYLVIGSTDSLVPLPPVADDCLPDAEDVAHDSDLKELLSQYGFVDVAAAQSCAKESPHKTDDASVLPPADLCGFWEKFVAEETAERDRLISERDRIFSDCRDVAYRLHAVVCHAGSSASAGHYWVWIHDFEHDVWRKYNDTTVSVHSADFVFGELNTKGEPYYLAYVRADEARNLVSIPRRRQRTPPPAPPRPRSAEDIAMADADDFEVTVQHVEDTDMSSPAFA